MRIPILAVSLALLGACPAADPRGGAERDRPAPEPSVAAAPPAAPAAPPAAPVAPPSAPLPAPLPAPRPDEGDLDAMRRALAPAVEATLAQPATDGTLCERAYEELRRFAQIARGLTDEQADRRLDRAGFLVACAALPEASQRCARPSYSAANGPECQRVGEALDPDTRERARALLREALGRP